MRAQVSALCACLLGVSMGEAGVSIMHDVNHGAGLLSGSARYLLGTGMDLVRACLRRIPFDAVERPKKLLCAPVALCCDATALQHGEQLYSGWVWQCTCTIKCDAPQLCTVSSWFHRMIGCADWGVLLSVEAAACCGAPHTHKP